MEVKFDKISDIKAQQHEENDDDGGSTPSDEEIIEVNVLPPDVPDKTEDSSDSQEEETTEEDQNDKNKKSKKKKESKLELSIHRPMILDFKYPNDKDFVYKCSKLLIHSISKVVIRNLHFNGAIEIERSSVTFENCILQNDQTKMYCIFGSKSSDITFTNSKIISSNYIGILVAEESKLEVTGSELYNTENSCIYSSGSNNVSVISSNLHDSKCNGIYVKDETSLFVDSCTFTRNGSACVYVDNFSSLEIKKCTFSELKRPAITISDSFNTLVSECEIFDCQDTTISVFAGTLIMKDTKIRDTRGNCIFLTSSSHAEITGGELSSSDYPAIILVNGCDGTLKDLVIKDVNESGLVLRSSSTIKAENVSIINAKHVGIKISDAENAEFKGCYVDGCGLDCVNICDLSTVKFNDCFIGGAQEYCFSIYTGSDVSIENSIIYGPYNKPACYIHRGGDAQIVGCGFAKTKNEAVQILPSFPQITNGNITKGMTIKKGKFVRPTEFEKNINEQVLKIDTKRPVFISKCFIFGEPKGFECYLNLEELNAIFESEQAVHMSEAELDDPNTPFMAHLKPPKCVTCGKVIRDFRLSTCGHSVYCQDCWNKLDPKPVNCPLCHTMITKAVQLFNESPDANKICSICYTDPLNCYLIPCGHTLCKKCLLRIFRTSDSCPFCREPNVQVRRFVTYE